MTVRVMRGAATESKLLPRIVTNVPPLNNEYSYTHTQQYHWHNDIHITINKYSQIHGISSWSTSAYTLDNYWPTGRPIIITSLSMVTRHRYTLNSSLCSPIHDKQLKNGIYCSKVAFCSEMISTTTANTIVPTHRIITELTRWSRSTKLLYVGSG